MSTLHITAGMAHIWPVLQPQTPQAADAVAMMAAFVQAIAARITLGA